MKRPKRVGQRTQIEMVNQLRWEMAIEKMMLDDRPMDQIVQIAGDQLKISTSTVNRIVKDIRLRWEQDMAEKRRYWKAMAIRRLMQTIQEARATTRQLPKSAENPEGKVVAVEPNWNAVIQAERLLSQIQGTQAPVEIRTEFEYSQAVANYMSNLTNEDMQAMIARYEELQRSAAILTTGESVPALPKSN